MSDIDQSSDDKNKPDDSGSNNKNSSDDKKENDKKGEEKKDEGADAEESGKNKKMSPRKRWIIIICAIVLLIVCTVGGLLWWLHARHYETSDDAFIDVHMVHIAPQVPGRVKLVLVNDNQEVHQGDPLIEIDPSDYQAQLDQAVAAQSIADADLEQAHAEIAVAEANATNAQQQLDRNQQLIKNQLISHQQIDTYVAQARSTAASLDAARKKENAEAANVKNAVAKTEQAQLNLSYTRIIAPEDSHVAQKNVTVGDYVQVGQNIMSLVPLNVWVTANFKETQLDHMQPGQPVNIEIDAYPGIKFHGHVDSVQRGGGGAFSLLPPENATGNYVKIVQRVPVKIVFDSPVDPKYYLGPGMSVVPTVTVR
jgi:membrane fusion protein (multidrug efflux system)